jgi:hypothetical protein
MPFATAATPVDLSGLTYDQQAQSGIVCNGVRATPTSGFQSCLPSQYTSSLISIPAPGTENDDHNPPRIAPRSLFDASARPGQHLPQGTLQGEPEPDRRECHRQVRAV